MPNFPISDGERPIENDILAPKEDICVTADCAIAAGNILETMDQTADPCQVKSNIHENMTILLCCFFQDFFQFSCGGWVANNEIPDGKARWGKFYELRDKVDKAVRSTFYKHFFR